LEISPPIAVVSAVIDFPTVSAIRHSARAQRFYQKKMARTNGAVATKALANKLARASYYIMRDQVPFDEDNLFR